MKSLRLRLLLVLVCVSTFLIAHAQYNSANVSKKAVEAYNHAIALAQDEHYAESIAALEDAVQKDARYADAWLSLGGVYGQMKNHEKSVAAYEKAFAIDSNYTSEYRLPYSINLAGLGRFDSALQTVNALLARPNVNPNTRKAALYRQGTYRFAVDYAKTPGAKEYDFKPQNLGAGVNTSESEYFPSLPVDGTELLFTRRVNNYNEDFFVSDKADSAWQNARRLTGSINTAQNEGAQIISQDGQWLVFTGCNRPGGFGSCDIYIAYKTNEGWSEAINLGGKVNSEDWESQPCLSPDKQDLYFTSRRPGGFGGSDLYVSHLGANGKWGDPQNLGAGINTSGDEACPFIHADNQSLYFTSNGWPGYGDEDLFVVRRTDSGWSSPQNLGYPINTIHREGTLFIVADGKTAYYASDRSEGKGGLDIYSFELRSDIRPVKTLWVRGKVFDKKTGAGLPSVLELVDIDTKKLVSHVQTNEQGTYLLTLPVGKNYAFNVARRGYLFYSDAFNLRTNPADSTFEKNIPLQPLEANASVVLKNIFFDVAKWDLEPASLTELDKLVALLQENPTVKIQVSGHTDNVGSAADNATLSAARAKAVVAYLVRNGIAASRLSSKGFGATQPIAENDTEAGRAQNRRTEVKVTAR